MSRSLEPVIRTTGVSGNLARTAFSKEQPVVGTYYFYWYDVESGAHFIDPDGTDALTRHPDKSEGYSYKLPSWHESELEDIVAADIDRLEVLVRLGIVYVDGIAGLFLRDRDASGMDVDTKRLVLTCFSFFLIALVTSPLAQSTFPPPPDECEPYWPQTCSKPTDDLARRGLDFGHAAGAVLGDKHTGAVAGPGDACRLTAELHLAPEANSAGFDFDKSDRFRGVVRNREGPTVR